MDADNKLKHSGNAVLNPKYGTGIFRRRIRLTSLPGKVVGELEDTMHGFRSTISHDGSTVLSVTGEAIRYPVDACPGAVEPLQELVGLPLTLSAEDINKQGKPFSNCTHLYDLSILAIAHANYNSSNNSHLNNVNNVRQYDVAVTDEVETGSKAEVWLDGELIHGWQAEMFQVTEPESLKGNTLFKGFSIWAKSQFSDMELEAAHVLQKGYFVAQARRYDMKSVAGQSLLNGHSQRNVCYASSDGVAETAVRLGSNERDFTDSAEQLLKFV